MATVRPERITDEFTELDQLEVIESSELKLSGSYHSYPYEMACRTRPLRRSQR